MKIVQISDTHLTHRGGATEENFLRVVAHVNDVLRPDLVVHSGDVVIADPDALDDHRRARELMAGFTAPVHVVPGNHDVGEPSAHPWMDLRVTDARVAAFEQIWGADRFRLDVDGFTVLGINSELLASGLDREEAQWAWLEKALADAQPVLLFLHKPLWPVFDAPVDHAMNVDEAAGERLRGLLDGVALAAVGCGHLHRYRQVDRGDAIEVWAPATAFLAAGVDPRMPEARSSLGVVEYDCDETVRARFVEVPGTVAADFTEVPQMRATIADIESRRVAAG